MSGILYLLEHNFDYGEGIETEFCGVFDSEEFAKDKAEQDCKGFEVKWTPRNEYKAISGYYGKEAYWMVYPININEYYNPCWIREAPKNTEEDEVVEEFLSLYGVKYE